MKKSVIQLISMVLIFAASFACLLFVEKQSLRHGLIRLHVVGASNSVEDQTVKLQVRDAVLNCLESELAGVNDMAQAKQYIQNNLSLVEAAANEALQAAGKADTASVSLGAEEFPRRDYDTFSLPSGVYESLRIVIGSGEGKNWWCVVFPALCLGASTDAFQDTAVSAGFSESLGKTLSGEPQYEIRFFLLDCLGKLENFFYFGS